MVGPAPRISLPRRCHGASINPVLWRRLRAEKRDKRTKTAPISSQRKTLMKFGIFMAPFHRAGENPTLCFERDLELIEWLDRTGYDEVFIGEHHSSGWEIISSPDIFIAAAAGRTRRIMLGSGVVSVPYHHPFNIANRYALL